jgi:quercetin dioxygenase-like cupin family protein
MAVTAHVLRLPPSRRRILTAGIGLPLAGLAPRAEAARPSIPHRIAAEAPIAGQRANVRELSVDDATKGSTSLFVFPEGWQGGGVAHYHSCSEEVFVLDGDITLDGKDFYTRGSYLYRPGGIVHGHHEASPHGSRMIIRTGGQIDFNYVRAPASPGEYVAKPSDDGRPHVLHLKTAAMPMAWIGRGAERYSRKVLSADAKTGAWTSLVEFPSAWKGQLPLERTMNWEWFVVAGAATLDDGTVYAPETYSYRPAGQDRAFRSAEAGTQILLWREP